jgi:hypothetical protein
MNTSKITPPLVEFGSAYNLYLPPHIRIALLSFFAVLVLCYTRFVGLSILDSRSDSQIFFLFGASVCLLGFTVTTLRFKNTGLSSNFYFKAIIVSFLILAFADVFGGVRIYQQPLLGVLRDFYWYAGFLIFPTLYMWRGDVRLLKQLVAIFIAFALVSVFLGDLASFFPLLRAIFATADSERFGLTRISSIETVPFAFYFFLVKVTKKRLGFLRSFTFYFCLAAISFNIFCVSMTRQIIISIIITSLYFYIRHCRFRLSLIQVIILMMIFACTLSVGFDFFDQVGKTVASFGSQADSADKQNVDVRLDAAEFYWQQFKATQYIGIGKISTAYSRGNIIVDAMENKNYFLSDLGLFAVLFQYGIPALLIICYVLFRTFKHLNVLYKTVPEDLLEICIAIELTLVGDIIRLSAIFFRYDFCFFYFFYFFVIHRSSSLTPAKLSCPPQ